MPNRPPKPIARTWPAAAVNKRKAAELAERKAVRLRREADELDEQWAEHVAARDAQIAAAARVAELDEVAS